MLIYFAGIRYLKSVKRIKKQMKTSAEKRIRNLLRKGDLISDYILILLILRESRFILPRPIL